MLRFLCVCAILFASACSRDGLNDLNEAPVPLGDFKLGHNIVVAPKPAKGPLSREATKEELTTALTTALAERFDRYEGDKLYHFGISVDGYVLAQPGVPLVVSPKSILILNVTIWDDAAGKKLNIPPEQITVFESLSGNTIVGSGLTKSAEEQLRSLSVNAAKQVELFLVKQMKEQGWFMPPAQ